MFHGFLLLGGKKCQQLFSCTGRGGELGSKAGLLVFITLKKMPKSLEKENRGRVPKIGMAGGLRMCLLLFFGFCSGVVLCSHWSRGLGETEFPSLSFVTLAHCVPSAIPLSAFSLTHLKSSNNNKGFKVSPWNCGAHRIPYRGAHFSQ